MSSLNLDNVQKAMDHLSETSEGLASLAAFGADIDAFRAKIPVKLNNAEARYILERLMQQRNLEGWGDHPTAAISHAPVTRLAAGGVKLLPDGFVIKAAIPASNFDR